MHVSVAPSFDAGSVDSVLLLAFSDEEPNLSAFGPGIARSFASGFVRRKLNDVTPLLDEETRVAVVGLGERAKFTPLKWKRAAGVGIRYLRDRGAKRVAVSAAAPGVLDDARSAGLLAAGALVGEYRASGYKSSQDDANRIDELVIVSADPAAAEAVERSTIVAEAANAARELVNTPASELPPLELAGRAVEAGRAAGLDVEIIQGDDLVSKGMVGMLAVGRGSDNPPGMAVLKHLPNAGQPPVVLIGKGITFDSGGISIKPGADMHHMKGDMGGAAAVFGAMVAIGRLNLPVNVIGLLPAAENMPDGRSYRPSDILRYANGKTVEIVNTDAEGRLVLADALIYAEQEWEPRAMVDLATLTGSCVVALGGEVSGVFTDDDALAGALQAAADASAEPVWRLPLYEPYRNKFDSTIADMKNAGDRWGGSITAALFLAEFVESTRWAHIDIAGPAFDEPDKPYQAGGGTGYGVQLLTDFVKDFRD